MYQLPPRTLDISSGYILCIAYYNINLSNVCEAGNIAECIYWSIHSQNLRIKQIHLENTVPCYYINQSDIFYLIFSGFLKNKL